MFNLDSKPAPDQKQLGISTQRGATNEQAIPVPYVAGRPEPLGLKWICDPFNEKVQAVTAQAGKDSDTVTGHNYWAWIAGLVCGGPVDALFAIRANGEYIWPLDSNSKAVKKLPVTPGLTRGAEDMVVITVPNFGNVRFYWGTDMQTSDPYLANSGLTFDDGSPRLFPAYRGFCYVVLDTWFLGFNQTNFQNIEFIVGKWPKPAWFSEDSANILNDCNGAAAIYDLLTNARQGVGLDDALISQTAFNQAATRLKNEQFGVSVCLTREDAGDQALFDVLDHFDGYCTVTNDWLLGIGLNRAPGDPKSGHTIDKTLAIGRPTFEVEDYSQVISELRINFTDAGAELMKSAAVSRILAVREINENINQPLSLERPFITRKKLAQRVADAAGKIRSTPARTGKVSIRRGTVSDELLPGAKFHFDFDDRELDGKLFRVLTWTLPDAAQPVVNITFEEDFTFYYPDPEKDAPEEPPSDPADPPPLADLIPPLLAARVVELPLALCPEGKLALAVLAARSDVTTALLNVWQKKNYAFDGDPPESYRLLATQTKFAQYGLLMEDFAAEVGTIDRTVGLSVQLLGVDLALDEQTDFDALADSFLVFIGDELFSVFDWRLEAAGLYRFFCARTRMATLRQAHAAGAEVFLIYSANILPLQHPHFQPFNTATLKLSPRTSEGARDLSDVDPVDLDIGGFIYKQTPPINLRVNGDAFAPSFAAGAGVRIDVTATTAGRDLFDKELLSFRNVFEFLKVSDSSLLGTWETPAGTIALTNAQLVALLGGVEQSFYLRAKFKTTGPEFILYSPTTPNLFVKKL